MKDFTFFKTIVLSFANILDLPNPNNGKVSDIFNNVLRFIIVSSLFISHRSIIILKHIVKHIILC
ncbi:hypothetical protein KQS06HV_91466 [Klebsiella quasipneumoniae subsp. similipneumoniae]|nr:hypothetical protein KQS06HV_91466 [Klebsiella quasipneumoniae subsp. similipneumoniae]